MKTALYLVVVIAAFALVQESAAAGLREKRNIFENIGKFGNDLKDNLEGIVDKLKDKLQKAIEEVKKILDKIDDVVKEEILNKLKKLFEKIRDLIKTNSNVDEVKQKMDSELEKVINDLAKKAQMDKTKLEALTNQLKEICDKWFKKTVEEYNSHNKNETTEKAETLENASEKVEIPAADSEKDETLENASEKVEIPAADSEKDKTLDNDESSAKTEASVADGSSAQAETSVDKETEA